MKYTFKYYISLGTSCFFGDVYQKDTFTVELTEKQAKLIKDTLEVNTQEGPGFEQIQEKLPDIDEIIMDELYGIASDYVCVDGYEQRYYDVDISELIKEDIDSGAFTPTKEEEDDEIDYYALCDQWEEWEQGQIESMSLHEKAEYIRDRYNMEVDNLDGITFEYYLPEELFSGDKEYWK